MRDALKRAVGRAGKRTGTPVSYLPRQAGARIFWTLSSGEEEHERQLSAPRRLGVVGLVLLTFLAAPLVWASTAFVDTPLATIPSAKASDGEDDDDDGEDTDTDGEGETDGDTGREDDTEDGEDENGDTTDNDGVATGAGLRQDTTDGAGDPGTVTTTSHNAAASTNTDTYTGPHLAGKDDDTGTTTSGNDGTTRTVTTTQGGTTAGNDTD
jgi:hypothetical protein